MYPTEVLAASVVAALIVVIAPGLDGLLAISPGLGRAS